MATVMIHSSEYGFSGSASRILFYMGFLFLPVAAMIGAGRPEWRSWMIMGVAVCMTAMLGSGVLEILWGSRFRGYGYGRLHYIALPVCLIPVYVVALLSPSLLPVVETWLICAIIGFSYCMIADWTGR